MKFPFRKFWGKLTVRFGEYTYYSTAWDESEGQRLQMEMCMIN